MGNYQILTGHCLETLAKLPDKSVHMCVTSPPYWGLRAYGTEPQLWRTDPQCQHEWIKEPANHGETCSICKGWRGEYGTEPTPADFIKDSVIIFDEVRRVLRDDGTLWVNIGDSYSASGHGHGGNSFSAKSGHQEKCGGYKGRKPPSCWNLKQKDLIGIPWALAFALRDAGWYLRSDIVWSKPNPLPESVRDRPSRSHEYIFMLSKSDRYFYDYKAVEEPLAAATLQRSKSGFNPDHWKAKLFRETQAERKNAGRDAQTFNQGTYAKIASGEKTTRNRRTIWTVAVKPLKEAHSATYPLKLIEPCILAGSSPFVCSACQKPYKPVEGDYTPNCACDAPKGCATVLDPFSGSGTTGMVSLEHGRNYIGCELNPEYKIMSEKRLDELIATKEAL